MNNYVVFTTLLNLRNALKIEIEDQEISRSLKNYKRELMDATVMVIEHLGPLDDELIAVRYPPHQN